MNRKNLLVVKIIAAIMVTAMVISTDFIQAGKVRQANTLKKGKVEQPNAPVVLRAYTDPYGAYGLYGEEPMGWFGDLLEDKLNIEIQLERHQLFGYEGDGYSFVQDADLYSFMGEMTYYEAVREGKLKDLEDDIKKRMDVYSKYANAIDHIKKDTYRRTGKKGVFGIPIWLESFEDTGRERFCISILSAAKNPEKAMDLITYSASDEGIMNIAFGPEGQMWKRENGNYVLLQDWYQIYEELQEPDEKFVETNHGKEDFHRAICKMELVGNESLGRELIGQELPKH